MSNTLWPSYKCPLIRAKSKVYSWLWFSPHLRSGRQRAVESSASDSDTTTELVALAWFGSLTTQFDGSLFFFNWRSYISKLVKVFNKGIQSQFVEGYSVAILNRVQKISVFSISVGQRIWLADFRFPTNERQAYVSHCWGSILTPK